MASAFRKDITRTIRNNLKRFMSIMVITILGVTMFCGLKASCADLRESADTFFDQQQLFDIQVLSTLGLTEDDVSVLCEVQGVEQAEGSFEESANVEVGGTHASVDVKALSTAGFNTPYVLQGSLPVSNTEVAVTQGYLEDTGKTIGDALELEPAQNEEEAVFERHTYTIVGAVIDVTDVNNSAGAMGFRSNTEADYTFFVTPNAVSSDVFTVVYIQVAGAKDLPCFSEEYEQKIAEVTEHINALVPTQEQARTDSVREEAQQELDDAWSEYETQKIDALQELDNAKSQLESSYAQLESTKSELDVNQQLINENKAEAASGRAELQAAQEQLDQGRASYKQAVQMRAELVSQLDQVDQGISAIDAQCSDIPGQISQLTSLLDQINQMLEQQFSGHVPSEGEAGYEAYQQLIAKKEELTTSLSQLQMLQEQRNQLVQSQAALSAAITQIDSSIEGLSSSYFDSQQTQLDAVFNQLTQGEQELARGQEQLDQGRVVYEEGLSEWQRGWQDYEQGRAEAQDQFTQAESELNDAQADIDAIEAARWYVQDRSSLSSYSSIQSDAASIEAIGTVFPLVFLVVGILVSLTAITRMVEEERGLLGTYKALGYRNKEIYAKYLVYALSACVSGCLLGLLCGFVVLPLILFYIFQVMYVLPGYPILFDPVEGFVGSAIFIIGIGITAFAACRSEVKQSPAALMRPKAPHSGSRILLERVSCIWKRLSFLNKVTARNLMRYKKRFFMTVIGVMGCSALLVCGFAIKDSVAKLIPEQYGKIDAYNIMAVVDEDDLVQAREELSASSQIKDSVEVRIDSAKIKTDAGEESLQLVVVPEGQNIAGYLNAFDGQGNSLDIPTDGILVSFNASSVLDFDVQDSVTIQDSALQEAEFNVSNITQNYLGNYVYMSQAVYEQAFGELETNAFLMHTQEGIDNVAFADELGEEGIYLSVVSTDGLAENFSESLMLLNMVVVIILVMAAALALAVLFTLSTTNISEREREIATIKVLGFRASEVHHYINKETLILTGIGTVVGLPLGFGLGDLVLSSLKMPSIAFVTHVEPLSYVLAAVLTMGFAVLVNLVTNRTLDKVDMISALKSVE